MYNPVLQVYTTNTTTADALICASVVGEADIQGVLWSFLVKEIIKKGGKGLYSVLLIIVHYMDPWGLTKC